MFYKTKYYADKLVRAMKLLFNLIFFFILSAESFGSDPALLKMASCLSESIRTVLVQSQAVNDYKKLHGEFKLVTSADNYSFKKFASGLRAARKSDYLFVDIETSVLKFLNDSVFNDMELSSAVKNRYKELVFESLQSNSKLKKYLVEQYSDFKRIRLAFRLEGTSQQAIESQLNLIFNEASQNFKDEITQSPFLRIYLTLESYDPKSIDPFVWNLMGVGYTDDQASTASRYAREVLVYGEPLHLVRYEDIQIKLVKSIDQIKKITNNFFKKYKEKFADASVESPFLALNSDSPYMLLTKPYIRLIRSIKSKGLKSIEEEVKIFISESRHLKGIEFSAEETRDFFEFYRLINELSLPPYITQGDFPHYRAKHGIVGFDMDGVGADHVSLTAQHIFKSILEGQESADEVLTASRSAVNALSESLVGIDLMLKDSVKSEMINFYQRSGVESTFELSKSWFSGGDDFSLLPDVELSFNDLNDLLRGILQGMKKNHYITPEKFRVVYVRQIDSNGNEVPLLIRSLVAKKADQLLKAVRAKIETNVEIYGASKNAIIALRVTPTSDGVGIIEPMIVKEDKNLIDILNESVLREMILSICNELSLRCNKAN